MGHCSKNFLPKAVTAFLQRPHREACEYGISRVLVLLLLLSASECLSRPLGRSVAHRCLYLHGGA